MSKTKTEQKSNIRDIELPPNAVNQVPEEIEPTDAEKMLEATRPYWAQIALGFCILLLAYVLVNVFVNSSRNVSAQPWQQLELSINQFRINQNVDSLKEMENDYPGEQATNYALQMAGDFEMMRGLQQLPTDREGGMKLVKKARESFQKVYDAPSTSKSVMQQRRSLFNLAYANESLGEFGKAKDLYNSYIEQAPEGLQFKDAQRGLARVSDPAFKTLYENFQNFKPFEDEAAPGAVVEDAPDIDFPEIDIPEGTEEGDPAAKEMGTEKPSTVVPADVENDFKAGSDLKPKTTEAVETTEAGETTEAVETTEKVEDMPAVAPAEGTAVEVKDGEPVTPAVVEEGGENIAEEVVDEVIEAVQE